MSLGSLMIRCDLLAPPFLYIIMSSYPFCIIPRLCAFYLFPFKFAPLSFSTAYHVSHLTVLRLVSSGIVWGELFLVLLENSIGYLHIIYKIIKGRKRGSK